MSDEPHSCNCAVVHQCHPDPGVQAALSNLVEEISRYDSETGSVSSVLVRSQRLDGQTFRSVTRNGELL